MKIFVTGVNGQLGHDVMHQLACRGHVGIGSDLAPQSNTADQAPYVCLDITDARAVADAISAAKPDAVIHCAAWTAVDAAEDAPEQVHAVNADGTRNLAEACRKVGAKMLYLSTDYVFDGQGEQPWQPDCNADHPLNVYGQTKRAGELAVMQALDAYFIVRIAWVFGKNGNNFVKTMLRLGKTHDTLRVVNDQIGTPTYTADLARLLIDMTESRRYGIYHATNTGGYLSWAEFAAEIFRQAGMQNVTVVPVTTKEYGCSKAARPFNSRLDQSKLTQNGFVPLPSWQDALSRYLKEIGE